MNERERLIEQYRLKHEKFPNYGPSIHYHDKTIKLMQQFDCKTLLDFGCGKGRLVEKINAMPEFEAVGYDPAINGREELPSSVFDCVTCLDVAEHWAPGAVSAELSRIRERCGRICLFAICCRPAVHLLPDGTNCHTSLHTAEQWIAFIDDHFQGWRRIEEKWHEKQKTLIVTLTNPEASESNKGEWSPSPPRARK